MKKYFMGIAQSVLALALLFFFSALQPAWAAEGNIHTDERYAWAENAGWINFRPTDGGVTVHDTYLTGHAWAENIGWIKLAYDGNGPYDNDAVDNWGVNADANGNLSGYAWNEIVGWINFNPSHSQVTIELSNGSFDGYAWAENAGWIHFKNESPAYHVLSPRLSVSDISVTEDSGPARFTINLSRATGVEVTMSYIAADGTAKAGEDFITTANTAIIPPGDTSTTVDVAVIDDAVIETSETFAFSLSNAIGAGFANIYATATIMDDDIDTDGDGLSDALENIWCTDPDDADTDNDGILDGWEDANHNGMVDTVETDPCNMDTDGDGIQDGTELGYTPDNIGPDTDTLIFQPDLDPETTTDPLNPDTDNDGWEDGEEDINYNGLIDTDETDPNNDISPVATPPGVRESIPHQNAGIDDDMRVPNNTSFAVRIQDSDGIDITDTSNIRFTVDDGVNPVYEKDFSDGSVRVVKLIADPDTQVTYAWAVYDRSVDIYGNFSYGADINIKVDIRDRRDDAMAQESHDFRIETEEAHNQAQANLPDTGNVGPNDPAIEGPYDTGSRINSGDLTGARIIYDSSEPVTPIFGPQDEVPTLDIAEGNAVGAPMNLQPPTVFNNPVKIFIPCPDHTDVSGVCVYLYNGTDWVLACDAAGDMQAGGEGWMVPGSRVNHNNGDPSTIEIRIYHFSGVQAGAASQGDSDGDGDGNEGGDNDDDGGDSGDGDEGESGDDGGGGCFIGTAAH